MEASEEPAEVEGGVKKERQVEVDCAEANGTLAVEEPAGGLS